MASPKKPKYHLHFPYGPYLQVNKLRKDMNTQVHGQRSYILFSECVSEPFNKWSEGVVTVSPPVLLSFRHMKSSMMNMMKGCA